MEGKQTMKHKFGYVVTLSLILIAGCLPQSPVDYYEMKVPPAKLREVQPLDLQEKIEEPNEPPAAPAPERISLSLEECRLWTIENNLDLKAELINPSIAAEALSEQEAKFESTFNANFSHGVTKEASPFSSDVAATSSTGTESNLGVNMPLQTGGTLAFNLTDQRSETNQTSSINPFFRTNARFSISQPLLRNAGRRVNLASIRIARYDLYDSEARTKLQLINVLSTSEEYYWRLYAARKELEVRQQQYELAQAQLDRAKRLVKAGERAEVEVLRAEAGMASQLEQIIIAENALRQSQRQLKRIMNRDTLPAVSMTKLIPVTEPDPVVYELDPEELMTRAMDNRMELLQDELSIARQIIRIDTAHNQTLPDVAFTFNHNFSGLGAGRSGAYNQLGQTDSKNYSFYLGVEIPLGNEAAKSTLQQALYQRIQLLLTKENRENLIETEVFNAVDSVQANWQRILAARQNVLLEARLTDAEIRQFEIGMRTSTDVLEAQTRLTNARSAEIQALTDYQISLVELAKATGTLLGSAKVDWQPATTQ